MSDVKRYDCYGKDALGYDYSALSREAIDGDWVLAEDHIAECDALAARLAETDELRVKQLRQQGDAWAADAARYKARLAEAESHRDMWQRMLRQMQDLAIARAARLAEVVGIVQRTLQPAGSPPPGGEEILIRWICDSANARLAEAEGKAAAYPHLMDVYNALGVRWGDNPFPIIDRLMGRATDSADIVTVRTSWKEREVARMIRDHQKIIDTKRKSCPRCRGTGAIGAPTSADDPSCPECDGEGTWAK